MSFSAIADAASRGIGHPVAVPVAAALIAVFHWITDVDLANIAISIVSLFLLMLLLHTSNRDGAAIQAKLDVLIRAIPDAPDRMIGIDKLTEEEVRRLRDEDCA